MRSIDAVWEHCDPIYIDKNGKSLIIATEENNLETWFYYDDSHIASHLMIDKKVAEFIISYFRNGKIKLKSRGKEFSKEVCQNRIDLILEDGKTKDGLSFISYWNDIVVALGYSESGNTHKTVTCFRHGEITVRKYTDNLIHTSSSAKGSSFYTGYAKDFEEVGPSFV